MKIARPVKRFSLFHVFSKMTLALTLYLALALFGWGVGHIVHRAGRIPDLFT